MLMNDDLVEVEVVIHMGIDEVDDIVDEVEIMTLILENLHEVESIARQIKSKAFVNSTATLVSYSNQKFRYLAETLLDEMIRDAGY